MLYIFICLSLLTVILTIIYFYTVFNYLLNNKKTIFLKYIGIISIIYFVIGFSTYAIMVHYTIKALLNN